VRVRRGLGLGGCACQYGRLRIFLLLPLQVQAILYCDSLPNSPGKVGCCGVCKEDIINVNVVAILGRIDHVLFRQIGVLGSKLFYYHIWEQNILLPFVIGLDD
jgi:hypothetical protein